MPRRARASVVNIAHHAYQRSMKGRVLFSADRDRRAYLEILSRQARKYKTDILAYCLLRDRVHIVAIPRRRDGLAKTIGRTHYSYTQYMNRRRNRVGQLWRDRFQSCMLDEGGLRMAVQYVECQPVYDRLVRKAEKHAWSSAQAHLTGDDEFEVLALGVWPGRRNRKQWLAMLAKRLSEEQREEIRLHTQTGRPLGQKAFVTALEKKLRRRLHALPIGRPPKQ